VFIGPLKILLHDLCVWEAQQSNIISPCQIEKTHGKCTGKMHLKFNTYKFVVEPL
jgi:hypothetical protein